MYSFFYGTFTHASMNNLDSARLQYISWCVCNTTVRGVSQGYSCPSQLKRRRVREREARRNHSEYKQEGKVGGKNNLKL